MYKHLYTHTISKAGTIKDNTLIESKTFGFFIFSHL